MRVGGRGAYINEVLPGEAVVNIVGLGFAQEGVVLFNFCSDIFI